MIDPKTVAHIAGFVVIVLGWFLILTESKYPAERQLLLGGILIASGVFFIAAVLTSGF